ncbi:transcription-repair coupling factor [Motiliproteus sp. MSK22-1]|uniref:transcription-repair coupling factor n=1 Tax=Motiliproteus sp. MSK22-1 TaxID=1897630 RepID=UPI0009757BC2|nr:transcription-repair coupling factor [Motiliproteus sp. MSK22-1]OMH33709.1 transcription-repair coupling factor [Motiliproteus sp. MSK22-1]
MATPPFTPIPPVPNGKTRFIGNMKGCARGLLIAEQARQHNSLTLVIAQNSESAASLAAEIRFFGDDLKTLSFPDWETLPYDSFSPHQDIISQRLYCLHQLQNSKQAVIIVPAATLMQRLPPISYLAGHSLILKTGQQLDMEQMRNNLSQAGYHAVDTVYEHGEYAIRGSIMDIFPMGSDSPYRIDLFDDEIDTLRTFDPENQRSIDQVESVRLLPAKEFPINQTAIAYFRQQWRERFDVDPKHCPTYQDVSNGIAPPGIEYYLPLFFDQTSSLTDYLPDTTQLFCDTGLESACQEFWSEVTSRHESRSYDIERPILSPKDAFFEVNQTFLNLKSFPRTELSADKLPSKAGRINLAATTPPELPIDAKATNPMEKIQKFLENHTGRVLFCAESAGRRQALLELLDRIALKPALVKSWPEFVEGEYSAGIIVAPLESGLSLSDRCIDLITENQLFGQRVMQRRRRHQEQDNSDLIFRNLTELQTGAPVVHEQHGVGRYLGLQALDLDGQRNEFLTLEYADGAKLYVPVSSLHLISRYSGASDSMAPLHKLGTEQWSKAKRKAMEKIRDTAAELLDIYARRAARKGRSFLPPDEQFDAFVAGFPFEETPDQAIAINAVIKDLTSKTPMDRLVCGDVGFGKTEVALRAAFIAVQNGHQVAILAPTTLLAQQHHQTFLDRFADWPVNIEVMSRFRSAKEQKATTVGLSEGKVDIVIGTHKLLQGNIDFKSLGLLIIDEEHRFGVQQKERIKSLRANIDILTLTATPIPRTLNMSMSGIRDLSIIATPPARRLSVNTFVREKDKNLIKEAILRELLRGGQVYYLHNEVKTIDNLAREIEELIPEARVAIGHGQMRERELEQVMSDFYHKRFNVLVCTTIIETGIDIPNANTIVIERADKFGLAQLHQLRGRVGRSHHQAYAYLLTPNKRSMTRDAVKRLDAIEAASDLGAGFTLATHDLEIRGAGELLGDDQSGQMEGIGFSLYMELLEEAIESIKAGKTPSMDKPLNIGAEINLRLPALIPDDYLPDVHNRLILYKRIANAKNKTELKELQVEMIDRFGLLPEPVKNLFRITQLKLKGQQLGISKLEAGPNNGHAEFKAETKVDPLILVKMVQSQPQNYRLEGGNRLKFTLNMAAAEQRFQAMERLLQQLTPQEH